MSNRWTAGHEDGLIVPSWGEEPPAPTGTWEVANRPAGGSSDLGTKALYWNVPGTSFFDEEGPSTRLEEPLPNEFFGSLWLYVISSPKNGSVSNSNIGDGLMYGYALNGDGTRKPASFAVWASEVGVDEVQVNVGIGKDSTEPSGTAAWATKQFPLNEWHQLDFHIRYDPVIVDIKLDCGDVTSSARNGETLSDPTYLNPPQEFALFGGPSSTEEAWIDNVVFNDAQGSFFNSDVCESGFPGTTFTGAPPPDIAVDAQYQEPEFMPLYLPHRGDFR